MGGRGRGLQCNSVRSSCFDPVALTTGQSYDVVEMVVVCVSGLYVGVDVVDRYVCQSSCLYVHTYVCTFCTCIRMYVCTCIRICVFVWYTVPVVTS